jgi:nitronate monooxygenase
MVSRILIQSPMANAQDWKLAASVYNGGALGSIPCATLSPQQIIEDTQKYAKATNQTNSSQIDLNLNFFAHRSVPRDINQSKIWRKLLNPYYTEFNIVEEEKNSVISRNSFDSFQFEALKKCNPSVVSFHFGIPPDDLWKEVKKWAFNTKCQLWATATTLDEGIWLEKEGVNKVIAQGIEAGGHRGMFLPLTKIDNQLPLRILVEKLVGALSCPIIATGGITTREDVKEMIQLKAQGVQIGTMFLLCEETILTPLHRLALIKSIHKPTILTNVFTGRLARASVNRIVQELGPISSNVPNFPHATHELLPIRKSRELHGDFDFSPLFRGINLPLLVKTPSQIIKDLTI